jgi:hypothetical protein
MRLYEFIKPDRTDFDLRWWPIDDDDYPVRKIIGNRINADSYADWGKIGVPWSETEMIGGGGTYMLKGDFGYVMLDAATDYKRGKLDSIILSQISVSERNNGIGNAIMLVCKEYADKMNIQFHVYKATNKAFFDKFNWLTEPTQGNYEYTPASYTKESINNETN